MQARRLAAVTATVIGVGGALLSPSAGRADDSSPLWRPGPPILYEDPTTAPQLTNSGPFEARPLLVSGAHAYVEGEFLYQDFLYDDSGANGRIADPNDKRPQADLFSLRTGTYSYPTDQKTYLGNAADLVELRVKPLDEATAFRITLTELQHPSVVGATIGIGSPGPNNPTPDTSFPDGANVSGLAAQFITVHGTVTNGVEGMNAVFRTSKMDLVGTAVPVSFDTKRAQITVRVPHQTWDPGTGVVRLSAGVGLWDTNGGHYLLPSQQSSTATPGGSGILMNPAAFFNVAFRENETPATVGRIGSPQVQPTACMWRDCLQAAALASNDISSLHEDVDFAKLAGGVTDRSGVPVTGSIDRILSSHFQTKDANGVSGGVTYAASNSQVTPPYTGEYEGRLQPYNLYVPTTYQHDQQYPLTLLLHSLSANYNQYMGTNNQVEFGEKQTANSTRGIDTLVATSEARGPDGWYYNVAEADVFEMWADIAKHYHLDSTRTTLTGYSMGGYATYKLGTQFPDLFARAFVTVGPPADGIWTGPPGVIPATSNDNTNTYFQLESLRNLPILIWHGTNDELVPADGPQLMARRLDDLGYRYEIDTFPGFDHFAFAVADNYTVPTAFLGDHTVDPNPPHITYAVNASMDDTGVGVVADRAYWLSGLRVPNPSSNPRGNVDVRSEGFCVGDAHASATQFGAGVAATPYTREYKTWADQAPAAPCADVLDVTTTNISNIVIDLQRAHVDCNVQINLHFTGVQPAIKLVDEDTSPCTGHIVAASVGGANRTSLSGTSGLPNTSAGSAGGGARGAAALVGVVGLLATRVRRRQLR